MKTYRCHFKAKLLNLVQGGGEVVSFWHTALGADGDHWPFVSTPVRRTKKGWLIREISRHGGAETVAIVSQASQDTLISILQELYCAEGECLEELEERVYWQGSRRPLFAACTHSV